MTTLGTSSQTKVEELSALLQGHLTQWHLARIKCLALLVIAVLKAGSVSYTRLSRCMESEVLNSSKLRRIQRFMSEFDIDLTLITRLILLLLGNPSSCILIMDRSNWQWGSKPINILMVSLAFGSVSIPLAWKLLDKKGCSLEEERIALLQQVIRVLPVERIDYLLADREFVGNKWMSWLIRKGIPFHLRFRQNAYLTWKGRQLKAQHWFNRLALQQQSGPTALVEVYGCQVYVQALRYWDGKAGKSSLLLVASYRQDQQALWHYAKRWKIENMFKALKSGGFHLEDTHLTHPERLEKLLVIVALAFLWACRVGEVRHKAKPIPVKKHKRPAFTLFSYGFDVLATALLNQLHTQVSNYLRILSYT